MAGLSDSPNSTVVITAAFEPVALLRVASRHSRRLVPHPHLHPGLGHAGVDTHTVQAWLQ